MIYACHHVCVVGSFRPKTRAFSNYKEREWVYNGLNMSHFQTWSSLPSYHATSTIVKSIHTKMHAYRSQIIELEDRQRLWLCNVNYLSEFCVVGLQGLLVTAAELLKFLIALLFMWQSQGLRFQHLSVSFAVPAVLFVINTFLYMIAMQFSKSLVSWHSWLCRQSMESIA